MDNILATPREKKKELSEKQTVFLDALFANGGNVGAAVVDAGYKPSSKGWLVKSLKKEILERAEEELASHASKAVSTINGTMTYDPEDAGHSLGTAKLRFNAAQDVLDRSGVSKTERVQVEGRVVHGIVLLPNKDEMQDITPDGI